MTTQAECPNPEVHGNPFRYCPSCDWIEPSEPSPPAAAASGTDDTYRMRRLMKAYDDGIDAATFYELAHEVGVRYVADAARSDLQAQLDQARADLAAARRACKNYREELERLRTGETCQVGQPAACGDFHTAGQCARTVSATERAAIDAAQRLRDLLRDILAAFCEPGYPGYPAMRSAWINVEQIKQWQEVADRG